MSTATSTSITKWASENGEFKRQTSDFRSWITTEPPKDANTPFFKAEPNRYHLYISLACPWAHRTLIVRALKGLEDVISLSVVDYLMGQNGWKFSTPEETPGCIPDTVNGANYIREIYFKADPNYAKRFTVPVLWDKKLQTIV
ncbi:hypothetical protein HK102_011216, partial [Quaeritorhiza haematococci]